MEDLTYFYHYTSIENLALILDSRHLRFTALDVVDDKLEGKVRDLHYYSQFVFVSCWTKEEDESIPLWGMSANNMAGVRIGLPKNPFNHYKHSDYLPTNNKSDYPFKGSTIINQLHFDKGFIFSQDEYYSIEVIYTNDLELLEPILIEPVSENSQTIWSAKVGRYKTKAWAFQNEVRYRLIVHPRGNVLSSNDKDSMITKDFMTKKHIDVPIRESALDIMRIMLGPKHTQADKLIVEALLNKYKLKCKLETSKLLIR